MAFKLNGNTRFIMWIIGVIFAAGGLTVMVVANTKAIDKHNARIGRVEEAVVEYRVMRDDVRIIKEAILQRQ